MWYNSLNLKKSEKIDIDNFFLGKKEYRLKSLEQYLRNENNGICGFQSIGIKLLITEKRKYKNVIVYSNPRNYHFHRDFVLEINGVTVDPKNKEFKELKKQLLPFLSWCNCNMNHLKNHFLILKNHRMKEALKELKQKETENFAPIYHAHRLRLAAYRQAVASSEERIDKLSKQSLSKKNKKLKQHGVYWLAQKLGLDVERDSDFTELKNTVLKKINEITGIEFHEEDLNENLAENIDQATKNIVKHRLDSYQKRYSAVEQELIKYSYQRTYYND